MTVPLLSSNQTTVLAFLPIALSLGGVGEFTGTIGMSAILGLVLLLLRKRGLCRPQNWRGPLWGLGGTGELELIAGFRDQN